MTTHSQPEPGELCPCGECGASHCAPTATCSSSCDNPHWDCDDCGERHMAPEDCCRCGGTLVVAGNDADYCCDTCPAGKADFAKAERRFLAEYRPGDCAGIEDEEQRWRTEAAIEQRQREVFGGGK